MVGGVTTISFLNKGVTEAVYQSRGRHPCFKGALINSARLGANT